MLYRRNFFVFWIAAICAAIIATLFVRGSGLQDVFVRLVVWEIVVVILCFAIPLVVMARYEKRRREAVERKKQEQRQQEEAVKALTQKLKTGHYTNAEIAYLIQTENISTEQKNAMKLEFLK